MGEEELEIIDPESYRGSDKGEAFSHSQLVMIALKKCIEAGSMEMREGYYNKKTDRFGNTSVTYIPDTRLTFIETVESAIMIMADDIEVTDNEKEAEENIKEIMENLIEKKENYQEMEEKEWNDANHDLKKHWQREGKMFVPGVLTQFFPYYNYYIMDKVQAYRKIVAELKKLTKRCDYYKEEFYEV